MLIRELFEKNEFYPSKKPTSKFAPAFTDDSGKWEIVVSNVKMLGGTSDPDGKELKFRAKATNVRNNNKFYRGSGDTADEAVNKVKAMIKYEQDQLRSKDLNKYQSFGVDLNVNFTRDIHDAESGWYRFASQDGQPVLVMATPEYAKAFGRDLTSLGFKHAVPRTTKRTEGSTITYGFPLTRNEVAKYGLIANGRYTVHHLRDDEDKIVFKMEYDSSTENPQDMKRLNEPGLTIAAWMKK